MKKLLEIFYIVLGLCAMYVLILCSNNQITGAINNEYNRNFFIENGDQDQSLYFSFSVGFLSWFIPCFYVVLTWVKWKGPESFVAVTDKKREGIFLRVFMILFFGFMATFFLTVAFSILGGGKISLFIIGLLILFSVTFFVRSGIPIIRIVGFLILFLCCMYSMNDCLYRKIPETKKQYSLIGFKSVTFQNKKGVEIELSQYDLDLITSAKGSENFGRRLEKVTLDIPWNENFYCAESFMDTIWVRNDCPKDIENQLIEEARFIK